jgi:hypothetical protein
VAGKADSPASATKHVGVSARGEEGGVDTREERDGAEGVRRCQLGREQQAAVEPTQGIRCSSAKHMPSRNTGVMGFTTAIAHTRREKPALPQGDARMQLLAAARSHRSGVAQPRTHARATSRRRMALPVLTRASAHWRARRTAHGAL